MKKFLQIAGIVFIALIGIGVIASLMDDESSSTESNTGQQTEKKAKIEILSQNVTNTEIGITIVAEVRNNTNKKATYVGLKSVFTDSTNVIVGTGMGNTLDLEPGQTRTIDVLSTDDASNVAKYRVEVDDVYWE